MTGLQHGDVLIKRIDKLPENIKPVERNNGRFIVAEGEATGHHHAIVDKGCQLYELNNELYLDVTSDTVTITHEEHKAIPIPTGIYKIGIVREYDYFQEMERKVVD